MKKHLYIGIALILLATIFVTFFSYTTSPIYSELGDTPDSPIFQMIGKYWTKGAIPYKDLWDLKGPYIFLVNATGYWLTGTRTGVYLLQIAYMLLTLIPIYNIFAICHTSKKSLIMTALSLMALSYIYEGGNLTEEYILPLLSLSFFLITKWLNVYEQDKKIVHPPVYALIYGFVLGLSLMSRLTNALSVFAAAMVIAVVLLTNKLYKNLFLNALSMTVGFTCSTLPFFAYFFHHSALTEMWNATFLYALRYAGNASSEIMNTGIHYFILSYLGSILLMSIAILRCWQQKALTVRTWVWMMSAALPFIWFCQGNGFGHYGMTVFPLTVIALSEIYSLRLKRIVLLSVIVLLTIASASKVRYMWVMYHWNNAEVANYTEFIKKVPEVDYSSFVAYNCSPNIYLSLDIQPATPFFALQDFAIERNPLLRKDVIGAFSTKQPLWILLSKDDNEHPQIQQILDADYKVVATDESKHITLYRNINVHKDQ